MSGVYLVNVGANTSHSAKARSPLFADGSWVYVSFPTEDAQPRGYSPDALPFIRGVGAENTHADPVWADLTYGDRCSNARAAALKKVKSGDVLLFWGLLWKNSGRDWSEFSNENGWYLLGALRVEEIATGRQRLDEVSQHNRLRTGRNPHFVRHVLIKQDRVFLGAPRYSARFSKAVDLAVTNPSGLLYSAFTSAAGDLLTPGGSPAWRSSLRSCRKMWDLQDPTARTRVELVREAIRASTGFDLLEDV